MSWWIISDVFEIATGEQCCFYQAGAQCNCPITSFSYDFYRVQRQFAAAKRLVFGQVGIDSEAGPSEVCIVADRSATPAWLASDMLSQAEHDENAQPILLTHVKSMATRVQDQLAKQLKGMKLQLVREIEPDGTEKGRTVVAVDSVGAGVGETVLFAQGSSARQTELTPGLPRLMREHPCRCWTRGLRLRRGCGQRVGLSRGDGDGYARTRSSSAG